MVGSIVFPFWTVVVAVAIVVDAAVVAVVVAVVAEWLVHSVNTMTFAPSLLLVDGQQAL